MEPIQKNNNSRLRKTGSPNNLFRRFWINNGLLVSGALTVISGLVLQFGFHIGHGRQMHEPGHETNYEQMRGFSSAPDVWGFGYSEWSVFHKYAIVLFALLMIIHIYLHMNWYKAVFSGKVWRKNRQVIILSVLFILTAFSGLIPWFVDLLAENGDAHFGLIEIHDKLALILVVFLVLHVAKRQKWFGSTFSKLAGKS
jgi:hypothetical protein